MRRAIAIDFDGCLCQDRYPAIGPPNWEVIRRALAEQEAGAALILWTCRQGPYLAQAVNACRLWGLVFDAVNENLLERIEAYGNDCRKISADEYWDDKAVRSGAVYGLSKVHDMEVGKDGKKKACKSTQTTGDCRRCQPGETGGDGFRHYRDLGDFLCRSAGQRRVRADEASAGLEKGGVHCGQYPEGLYQNRRSGPISGRGRRDRVAMNKEFSKRLKRLRDRKQINQKIMGERCGLSKDIIGKYERGEREPSSSSLEKLADFFEMSMDELWRGRKNF